MFGLCQVLEYFGKKFKRVTWEFSNFSIFQLLDQQVQVLTEVLSVLISPLVWPSCGNLDSCN